MSEQPETLRLAEALTTAANRVNADDNVIDVARWHVVDTAAELRRQHSRIKELEAGLMVALGEMKDAARYRWIRDHDTMNETEGLIYRAQGDKAQVDAEIDMRILGVRRD